LEDSSATADTPAWVAPWEFAVHGAVVALLFLIVAAFAIALDLVQQWLERRFHVSHVILYGLQGASFAIFATDLILFAVALYRGFKRTLKVL
jgi:hypothetical protein